MSIFYQWNHPTTGTLTLGSDGTTVRLSCHLPFDVQTNEWIDVSNSFALRDYCSMIRKLSKRPVHIQWNGSELTLKVIGKGLVEVSVSETTGSQREEYALQIPGNRSMLLPRSIRRTLK